MSAIWAGPDSLDELRAKCPGHFPPVCDHNGFELQIHPGAAMKEIDELHGVKIPRVWTQAVPHATRSSLRAERRVNLRPHSSFDVDGDGFVSQDDYRIAKQHDVDRNGTLSEKEREVAITARSHYMGTRLQDDEIGGNARARRLMSSLREAPALTDRYTLNRRMNNADVSIRSLKQRSSNQLKECLYGGSLPPPPPPADGPVYSRSMLIERRKANTARDAAASSEAFLASTAWPPLGSTMASTMASTVRPLSNTSSVRSSAVERTSG